MQISSHELARCADYLSSELKTIRDKVEFYATDELKKRKGSKILYWKFQRRMIFF